MDADLNNLEALPEVEPPEEEWFIVEGEIEGEELPRPRELAPPYNCPSPTKWRKTGEVVKTQGRWMPVSSGVVAKHGDIQHTFRAERSVTWGVALTGSIKGSLRIVEMETGLTLDTHTTLTTSETLNWTVKKGTRMALFAAPGYVVRKFARTAYGGAMCNVVKQAGSVYSPHMHLLKVDYF